MLFVDSSSLECRFEKETVCKTSKKTNIEAQTERLRRNEESLKKNVAFLQALTVLSEEIQLKDAVPMSLIDQMFYDNPQQPVTEHKPANILTEDSGIGYSEGFSGKTAIDKFVSSNDVKYALQSVEKRKVLNFSLKAVINHLREESGDVYYNRQGYLNEHVCNVINKCSQISEECRNIVVEYINEVIDAFWNDHRIQSVSLNL